MPLADRQQILVYNGISDISALTRPVLPRSRTSTARRASRCALGVFTNLIETDEAKRAANLAYFERHMQYASEARIPVVATECGFDPASRGVRVTSTSRASTCF